MKNAIPLFSLASKFSARHIRGALRFAALRVNLPMMLVVMLGATTLLLTRGVATEHFAVREFAEHRMGMAELGGGVFLILHPVDCSSATTRIDRLAYDLQSNGIVVLGAVLRDYVSKAEMADLLTNRNRSFPHAAIRRQAVSRLAEVAGHMSTPLALLVGREGRILAVEPALERGTLVEEFITRLRGIQLP
ncbi:hypothetical protein [Candidatus Palauibacter sp.]|uniref:hypothetical protein n=1 Tax=Candidatus Palauibacter sp. TaxID=3101350 RepID=UPI003C6ED4C7